MFCGEGGERKIVRRIRAISAPRGIDPDAQLIRVSPRVPHLNDRQHLERLKEELAEHPARLVIIDPLYLAASGASGSNLYEMGAHLESVQHACQAAGAALLVVHHWTKTGRGTGAQRMSGVGPGAWGRVLVSGNVESRHTEPSGASNMTVAWEFSGDEVADQTVRVRRRVWTDDAADLSSRMHYETSVLPRREDKDAKRDTLADLTPTQRAVAAVVARANDGVMVSEVVTAMESADEGEPVGKRAVQDALAALRKRGFIDATKVPGGRGAKRYTATDALWAAVGSRAA
jgi:hypothetical protein